MAKKPAEKPEPAQAPQAAGAQKKIGFVTLKHWATGTVNQTGQPILIIETQEGSSIGIRLTPQQVQEIGKALSDLLQSPDKTN